MKPRLTTHAVGTAQFLPPPIRAPSQVNGVARVVIETVVIAAIQRAILAAE